MLQAFGASHRGCVRENNEDCFLVLPDIGLYLVADGMGGARAGEHASRLAAETVAEFVRNVPDRDGGILLRAFEEAHRRVRAEAAGNSELQGMGTTLVAVLDAGDRLIAASVGDSRAYLYAEDHLRVITEDQTWVEEVGRPMGLPDADLRSHPLRHVLTMAIGAAAPLRARQYELVAAPGSQILLSSDGLHGVLDPDAISEALKSPRTLEARCHYLIDSAVRAGGPDNVTVVLLSVVE
jgi:protein phosphatase